MKKIIFIMLILLSNISFATTLPSISGKNAIAIETSSGRILYEKDAFNKANIASTTKIMTAIIAIENNSLDDVVKISKNAASTSGSSAHLSTGDEILLSELLYGLLLNSGNDAAVAIAEHTSVNIEEFSNLMNKKAEELGALNTHFVTPHGLDKDGHYSTAYDMAIIARYALSNDIISKIVSTQFYTMHFINNKTIQLKNTNPLLSFYNGITGMKTGYTGLAGKCIVASAKRNDLEIIVVTLGEPSSKLRISDTVKILNYCFDNYKMYDLREIYPINFSLKVEKATKSSFLPIYKNSLVIPLLNVEKENIKIRKYINENLVAPLSSNQNIGKIQFLSGTEVIGEIDICVPYNIKRTSIYEYFKIILQHSYFSEFSSIVSIKTP